MSGAEIASFLDNGCGEGRLINKVAKYPVKEYWAWIISKRQLLLAKKRIK